MEHIKFQNINIKKDLNLINSLKANKIILQFLKDNNLSIDYIENNAQALNTYLLNLKPCEGCKGLKDCKQSINGKVFKLKYDGILSSVLVPCKFKVQDTIKKAHLKNFVINDMSEKFYDISFENINIDEEVKNKNMDYIAKLPTIVDSTDNLNKGLYLVGKPGVGKSFLAACAANKFAKSKKSVAFVNVPLLSQRIKTNLENNEYKNEVNKIVKVDFVVLDDIGAETVTSWFRDDILFNILNERMENNRLTWFTSNEDFKSLKNHYELNNKRVEEKIKGERIMARIKSLSNEINIDAKDRRI